MSQQKRVAVRMNPVIRQQILFSLSQPTNPVPGAVLRHLTKQATPALIRSWLHAGWIGIEQNQYILTEKGCSALCEKSPINVVGLNFQDEEDEETTKGIWYR